MFKGGIQVGVLAKWALVVASFFGGFIADRILIERRMASAEARLVVIEQGEGNKVQEKELLEIIKRIDGTTSRIEGQHETIHVQLQTVTERLSRIEAVQNKGKP